MRIQQIFLAAVAVLAAATMSAGAPSGGTVTGKVTYTGTPAKAKAIDMSKEPSCAAQHSTPQMTETAVTGPGNTLENVVIYISEGAPAESSAPSSPATFDQKGCHYAPHVLAFQVNQELKVTNSDQTSHNIHPWMHGYFAVLTTSHYAVSDANGEFKLPNLPPGKYTLTAWQESYGTQTQEVTISGSETKTVNFAFTAKPY